MSLMPFSKTAPIYRPKALLSPMGVRDRAAGLAALAAWQEAKQKSQAHFSYMAFGPTIEQKGWALAGLAAAA
jgi:hypothetical protein